MNESCFKKTLINAQRVVMDYIFCPELEQYLTNEW